MEALHFIRPHWLWALIPLCLLVIWMFIRKRNSGNWLDVIDPQLVPHVLVGKIGKQKFWPIIAFTTAGILTILALAGPAWERLPTPVFRNQSALLIALDLSLSMDSTDIKPSRLKRAQHKITDILNQRKDGQTALIVYAANAFTVTPFTQDTETINAQIPSLSTDIMPAQGSRPDIAIQKALELFEQANIRNGELLFVTDGMEGTHIKSAIEDLRTADHTLSILAVGTAEGAPIVKYNGGFLTDESGAIVIPKLNELKLRELTVLGNGNYHRLTTDDTDILYILGQTKALQKNENIEALDIETDTWREEGPWLVLLLLPLASLAFRRGVLAIVILLILPLPKNTSADTWDKLWLNKNQQAHQAFRLEKHQQAAEKFNDPLWKSSAYYRAGDYQKALDALEGIESDEAFYNKGNALARLGKIPEAIQSYEQSLAINVKHEDAQYNLDLLKKLQQQQQSENQQSQDQQQNQESQDQQQNQESQDQQNQNQQTQNQESQNQESQDQQTQNQQAQNQESQEQQAQSQKTQNQESQEQQTQNQHLQEQEQDQSQADQQLARREQQENDQNSEPEHQLSEPQAVELSEEQQATQQWLRRIPDDPGGLLRRKFKYQYRKKNQNQEEKQW